MKIGLFAVLDVSCCVNL